MYIHLGYICGALQLKPEQTTTTFVVTKQQIVASSGKKEREGGICGVRQAIVAMFLITLAYF